MVTLRVDIMWQLHLSFKKKRKGDVKMEAEIREKWRAEDTRLLPAGARRAQEAGASRHLARQGDRSSPGACRGNAVLPTHFGLLNSRAVRG